MRCTSMIMNYTELKTMLNNGYSCCISSSEEKISEKCNNLQLGSESEVPLVEAGTVSCLEKPNSAMNWINGVNKVENGKNCYGSIRNVGGS